MKNKFLMIVAAALCAGVVAANAADKKHLAGPKGGRLLENTEPKAEFYLEKDHTSTITFYDKDLKAVPASDQTVAVVAEAKSGKQKIEFEKKGELLVSKGKLPEEDAYNVVVQLKQNPEAKPQNFRFKLDLATCGSCKRAEYACICDE